METGFPVVQDAFYSSEMNPYFRSVKGTGKQLQYVNMTLKPGEDIGLESHEADQIFLVTKGIGKATVGDYMSSIQPHSLVFVPSGTKHNIANLSSDKSLTLITIYGIPQHPAGQIDQTKQAAEKREKNYE